MYRDDNDIREIPLRILHEWDKINNATQRRKDRGQQPIQGVGLPHTRFGLITNAEGKMYKCHACQELFEGLAYAVEHVCPWETEFREYCNRPILQVLPGHSIALAQRVTELERRLALLEGDKSKIVENVDGLADFNAIPGRTT